MIRVLGSVAVDEFERVGVVAGEFDVVHDVAGERVDGAASDGHTGAVALDGVLELGEGAAGGLAEAGEDASGFSADAGSGGAGEDDVELRDELAECVVHVEDLEELLRRAAADGDGFAEAEQVHDGGLGEVVEADVGQRRCKYLDHWKQ